MNFLKLLAVSLSLFSVVAYAHRAGNGGDFDGLLKALNIHENVLESDEFSQDVVSKYRHDFLRAARVGLDRLGSSMAQGFLGKRMVLVKKNLQS